MRLLWNAITVAALSVSIALVPLARAQQVPSQQAPAEAPAFKKEEIEQLVAPIALYPDSLVAQILMASTYPLEVVEAARWVKAFYMQPPWSVRGTHGSTIAARAPAKWTTAR